jgi:hypothetical protein
MGDPSRRGWAASPPEFVLFPLSTREGCPAEFCPSGRKSFLFRTAVKSLQNVNEFPYNAPISGTPERTAGGGSLQLQEGKTRKEVEE